MKGGERPDVDQNPVPAQVAGFAAPAMTKLKPSLGPVQLLFYCVGVIVGAGVYSVIGPAAGLAGHDVWLSFILAAVVALLTGFSYAEMATTFPQAGAEYIYIRRTLPRSAFWPFAIGLLILAGGAATAATVAIAFGGYLQAFVNIRPEWSALALLAACSALNAWGLRESSWVNIVFTCIEIGGLLFVIAAGAFLDGTGSEFDVSLYSGLLPAAAILFFVFLGFEEIANLAEEIHDPARNLPRVIFLSIGITTLLYVLVSLAVVALVPPAELAASKAPLTLAIGAVWPASAALMSAIALFATANTVLITLVATSRLAFSLARDAEIPAIFARVSSDRLSPWAAAALAFATAIVLLPLGNLKVLAELSSFIALLAFLAVNLTLIVLRFRQPELPGPFRVPLSVGRLPLIPVFAMASIVVLLASFEMQVYAIGGGIVATIAVAFAGRRALRSRDERAAR
jgi:basic amino acid/polyamine antiporter, APA family